MKIGGFLSLSLSDYPGQVAAVIFTQGCNFRCPFCHNGSLIPRDRVADNSYSEEEVLRQLTVRRRCLDAVVVSGGEPTLHHDLRPFIQTLQEMGFAVKLDTNGSRPDVLRDLLDRQLLDYVAMDIKAPLTQIGYKRLAGTAVNLDAIQTSIDLLVESGIEHEFRTTHVEPLLDKCDMQAIQEAVPLGSHYRVQKFLPENAHAEWLREEALV